MCYESDDYCEFYKSAIRKSRKSHKCTTCGKVIEKGQLYRYATGKFQGDLFTDRTCGSCELRVYRLHVMELTEGCPDRTSWYPPYDAMEETEQRRADWDRYYKDSPEDRASPHGQLMEVCLPLLEDPDADEGQSYLRRLNVPHTKGAEA